MSTLLHLHRRCWPRALLVLFHGLEGSSASHYAQAFAVRGARRGWALRVPHFRGCSGELNLAPRAYHSGDFEEIGWILGRLRLRSGRPLLAAGVSLGGNALLRWARRPATAPRRAAPWPRCVAAGPGGQRPRPSAAASTGRSTRACSCAP
jgi:predicted alpha/beta-fold hydrolase